MFYMQMELGTMSSDLNAVQEVEHQPHKGVVLTREECFRKFQMQMELFTMSSEFRSQSRNSCLCPELNAVCLWSFNEINEEEVCVDVAWMFQNDLESSRG